MTSVIPLNTDYLVTEALTKAATTAGLPARVARLRSRLRGHRSRRAALMDQDQWAHAFGVAANVPSSAKATTNADGTPVDSTPR